MWDASAEAIAALKGGHGRTWRLLRLAPDTFDVVEGFEASRSILIEANISAVRDRRNRYSGTGSIANPTATLPWTQPGDPFFPLTPWRLEAGVWLPTSLRWEWIPQMTGLIEDPEGGGGSLSFSLADPLTFGDEASFTRPDTIPRGTSAGSAIRWLLEQAAIGPRFDIIDGGRIVDADLPCERGEIFTEKAYWIAQHLALDLYSSRLGIPTVRPMPTEAPAASWTFARGIASTFTAARRQVGIRRLYNHTHVTGTKVGELPVYGEWRDTNPLSPVWNPLPPQRGPMGDRLYPPEVSAIIGDAATAYARALALGQQVALLTDDVTLSAVATLVLDPLDVVRNTEPEIDADHLESWLDVIETGTAVGSTQTLRSRQVRNLSL